MKDAAVVYDAWFSVTDGGGSGTLLGNTSIALGLGNGTVISGASVSPIRQGSAVYPGAYLCREPGQSVWHAVSHGNSGSTVDITAIPASINAPRKYTIAVLGATASDDGTARVIHFIDGAVVANHAVSLANVFLSPFQRMTANQGEVAVLETNMIRINFKTTEF
jgi:hypothetical protein